MVLFYIYLVLVLAMHNGVFGIVFVLRLLVLAMDIGVLGTFT